MEELINEIESQGFQWDVGFTGALREARVWKWPYVVGRYSPNEREPAFDMLEKAAIKAGVFLEKG